MFDRLKSSLSGEVEEDYDYENEGEVQNNRMILLEPRAFSESQQIADYLKSETIVVVNLKRVTNEDARRVVDFLGGTLYAIGGDIQNIGPLIFLCTPRMVQVQGKITEEETGGFNDRLNNGW